MTAYRQTPPGYVWVPVPCLPAHLPAYTWIALDGRIHVAVSVRLVALLIRRWLRSWLQKVSDWLRSCIVMALTGVALTDKRERYGTLAHLLARAGEPQIVGHQLDLWDYERAG